MNRTAVAQELVMLAKELISKKETLTPYTLGWEAGDYMRRFEDEGPDGPNNLSVDGFRKQHGFAQQKRILGPDLNHDNLNEWNRGYKDGHEGKPRTASMKTARDVDFSEVKKKLKAIGFNARLRSLSWGLHLVLVDSEGNKDSGNVYTPETLAKWKPAHDIIREYANDNVTYQGEKVIGFKKG